MRTNNEGWECRPWRDTTASLSLTLSLSRQTPPCLPQTWFSRNCYERTVSFQLRLISHHTHTVIPCPSVTHTDTPSLTPGSLYTGSPLCTHCFLCYNDLEISGLVIISAFPTNQAITPSGCCSDHYGYVYLVCFKARRLSTISINCQAMHWFQMGYHYTGSYFKNITHSSASGHHCWSRCKALLDDLDEGLGESI